MSLRGWVVVLLAMQSWSATAASAPFDEPRFQSVGVGSIPRDVVPAMAQDRAGFLWVATGDGLMRYDGHRFRPQERESDDPEKRNLGWIQVMLAARDGRLWIGTEVDGLAAYEPATDSVVTYGWPGQAGSPRPTVTALAEDVDGSVWVGTVEGGLQHFDPKEARFTRDGGQPLADARISALLVDRSGAVWVGTWNGLILRRPGSDRFEPVTLPRAETEGASGSAEDAAGSAVRALFQASDGQVWVGTADGALFRIAPGTVAAQSLAPLPALHRALAGAVTSLAEAPGGQMWVGRSTGIDLHDLNTGQLLHRLKVDPRRRQGLAGKHVTSLLVDRAGSIWVAGFGLGLQRHEPGSAIRVRAADLDQQSPAEVSDTRAVVQLRSGEIWAAVHESGIVVMDEALMARRAFQPRAERLRGNGITAMAQMADGSVWLGGDAQLEQRSASGNFIRQLAHAGGGTNHLAPGPDDSLWISTEDGLYRLQAGASAAAKLLKQDGLALSGMVSMTVAGPDATQWVASTRGLFKVAPGTDVLQAVQSPAGAGLASPVVLALLFAKDGTLWLDTAVSGLHRLVAWEGERAKFDQVSARHGVFNRPFGVNLLEDASGRVWTHMAVYDPRKNSMRELGAADGVHFGTGWFRSYARLNDGRLIFGGSRGLLVVDAAQFRASAYAPPLAVSELRINGVREPWGQAAQAIELGPDRRSLSVEFAMLDFLHASRSRYAFRLEGFDTQWTATGAEARVAAYSNLEPGNYVLRVRTSDVDGARSPNELALAVRVLPAWWQQIWFKAVLLLLLGLGVIGVVQLRTRRLRAQRAELQAAVAARTTELEAARQGLEQRVQERTHALSLAMRAAESASRAKTSFLLNMSHEMRTPLNAILGLTHLQREATKDPGDNQRLGKVENAAQHLLGVINDVLDFSSIEAGEATLAEAPFDLVALVDGLADMLAVRAKEKQLDLQFEMEARVRGLPALLGDRQRITGILLNLAGNALKFTVQGHVRVGAVVVTEDADSVSLRFDVADTGPGIAPQAQARLFSAFEQADSAMTRRHGGVGLGLAISRRWAEMMKGTIGLSSVPGQGSRFWFAVQLRKVPARPDAGHEVSDGPDAGQPAPADYGGRRVLLVEDDPVNQLVAATMLQGRGLQVDLAEDGAAAIRMANAARYDLIFMDLQMPEVDGLEATRAIRSSSNDRDVPIVGLTAFTSAADRQRCLDAGMNDHVGKPVVPAKLFAAVQQWLRQASAADAVPRSGGEAA